jgi:hypothetical protein
MGFSKSKTHERDSISGLHVHNDKANVNGEFSVDQLRSLMDSRQAGINDAIRADWPENMTATNADIEHPTYGNAGEKFPRPTDVSSKGQDRYGVSVTPGKQSAKEAPRSNSKVSK